MIVKNIAIVGGGSAGWSAAAYITNQLPNCKVTLIDKEVSTPIGVGEATILSFKPFMDACGFDYWEWLNNIDATPKAGILYPNWIREGNNVWHPFSTSDNFIDGILQYEAWTNNKDLDFKRYAISSFDTAVVNNTVVSEARAYHVDCIKFVNYVKTKLDGKVNHIKSGVANINREGDSITSLDLENGKKIIADLYIDCSGFKNLLVDNPERVEVYGRLFCNRALSCYIEYINREIELRPYTTAMATEIGWMWIIPTRSRIGAGIVYDKNITSDEEAQEVIERYIGTRPHSSFTKHNWDPYYKPNNWQGNVVSIGLSAGFIEPLESTGLALIHLGVVKLVDKLKHYYFTKFESSLYNAEMNMAFEDAIDFVSMHYSYTERTEPFWENVKKNYSPSDRLKELMQSHVTDPILNNSRIYEGTKIFSPMNYALWLEQLGYTKPPIKLKTQLSKDQVRQYLMEYADIGGTLHTSFPAASSEVAMYENFWYNSTFRPPVVR